MQVFPCPFCGDRDEGEFFYAGEFGKVRPSTDGEVSTEEWTAYLHETRNDKGTVREVWMHLPCSEFFAMERDSATMAVIKTITLREETT